MSMLFSLFEPVAMSYGPFYERVDVLFPPDSDNRKARVTAVEFNAEGLVAIACVYDAPRPSADDMFVDAESDSEDTIQPDADAPSSYGRIQVYALQDGLEPKHSFHVPAHPTALVWIQNVLVIGDRTGAVTMVDGTGTVSEPYYESEHWSGGEIRAMTANKDWVALGTPARVHIAKHRAIGGYKPSLWYERKVALFRTSTPNAANNVSRPPVSLALVERRDTLVVTYQIDGIGLYDTQTGHCIHHFLSASDIIGCSALSPNGKILAAVNYKGGIDTYLIEVNQSRFDHTIEIQPPAPKLIPVTVTFTTADKMLVGGTCGGIRLIRASDGMLRQTLHVRVGDAAFYGIVHEVAYASWGQHHYVAFGTAEEEGNNRVAFYRAPRGSQWLRYYIQAVLVKLFDAVLAMAIVFISIAACIGSYVMWLWLADHGWQVLDIFKAEVAASDLLEVFSAEEQGAQAVFEAEGVF